MSKALYTFLSYPDSSDVEEIAKSLQKVGWPYAISPLHDKDIKADGTPKKPHYHWLVGFAKKPLDPASFEHAIKALGGVCVHGEMIVHDPWGAFDYLTHEHSPDKYHYMAHPITSQFWDLESYTTPEQRNEHRKYLHNIAKKTDASGLSSLLCMIGGEKEKCHSFAELVDTCRKTGVDMELLMKNAYFLQSYIKSKMDDLRMQNALRTELDSLRAACIALETENKDLKERLEFAEHSAALYYEQMTGEQCPPSWEWDKGKVV